MSALIRRRHVVVMSIAALTRPGWMRPSLIVMFVATLLLHLWGLDRNGWATTSYSAAVRAGATSWSSRRSR
jgi:hypothetical protein